MGRWLCAVYQKELPFKDIYLPIQVFRHEFPISELKGKSLNNIISVLKSKINTIERESNINRDYDEINAYSFDEAFSEFIKNHISDKNIVFEVCLEKLNTKEKQTKLVCPLISEDKSYDRSKGFNTLITAISYKLTNEV